MSSSKSGAATTHGRSDVRHTSPTVARSLKGPSSRRGAGGVRDARPKAAITSTRGASLKKDTSGVRHTSPTVVNKLPVRALKRPASVMQAGCVPPCPQWASGDRLDHPCWEEGLTSALMTAGFFGGPRVANVNVWSDCAGMATEMFAGRKISAVLRRLHGMLDVNFHLYFSCDADPSARDFAEVNWRPKHASGSIEGRDLAAGTFDCSKCRATHTMPAGIDLYVAGYPCTPWSRLSARRGPDHPAVEPFMVGIRTVNRLKPLLWLYETTAGADDTPQNEAQPVRFLDTIQGWLRENLKDVKYISRVIKSWQPTWAGYPTRRPRIYVMNWREDVVTEAKVMKALSTTVSSPTLVRHTYASFLRFSPSIDWLDRVDCYPTGSELQATAALSCKCSMSPWSVCDRHPCGCRGCGKTKVMCRWRASMSAHLSRVGLSGHLTGRSPHLLTYCQVLGIHGIDGPQSPRVRNMLNVIATDPRSKPLSTTLAVVDTSPSVSHLSARWDGAIPCVTRNSALFSLRATRLLTTYEVAALMGLDLADVNVEGLSESQVRKMLGNMMHVGNLGGALLCMLAGVL